jgi:hypothetical protein
MPPLSLNQAARESKKSKATLLDAIRSGRMSAAKDDQGRYQIDPAELFRVYPATGPKPATETDTDRAAGTADPSTDQEKTALLERLISLLTDERDDLRTRLDKSEAARQEAAAEIRRLTLMVTYQPERQENQPQPDPTPVPTTAQVQEQPPERPPAVRAGFWFALIFAALALAGAWWLWPLLQK